MTIRDEIEKVAHDLAKQEGLASGFMEGSCKDYYENGVEKGALWAMRWFARRWTTLRATMSIEGQNRLESELDAAAAEILGGER